MPSHVYVAASLPLALSQRENARNLIHIASTHTRRARTHHHIGGDRSRRLQSFRPWHATNRTSSQTCATQPLSPYNSQVKTTKKVVLKLKCVKCSLSHQIVLKRCKHFELGGNKKTE